MNVIVRPVIYNSSTLPKTLLIIKDLSSTIWVNRVYKTGNRKGEERRISVPSIENWWSTGITFLPHGVLRSFLPDTERSKTQYSFYRAHMMIKHPKTKYVDFRYY